MLRLKEKTEMSGIAFFLDFYCTLAEIKTKKDSAIFLFTLSRFN